MTLTTGRNEWDRGLDVVVEGDAGRVTDGRTLERLADAWATRWDGRWKFEVRDGAFQNEEGGHRARVRRRPKKVLAFGKGTFSQTSHRF